MNNKNQRIELLRTQIQTIENQIREIENEPESFKLMIESEIPEVSEFNERIISLILEFLPKSMNTKCSANPDFAHGFNHCIRKIKENLK